MQRSVCRLVGGLVLAVCVAGCGDSPTSPGGGLQGSVPQTLLKGGLPSMEVLTLFAAGTFTTPASGRVEVTVDWTSPTNNIDVYVTKGTCTVDQVNDRTCNFAILSESTTARPEKLSATLDAATYSLMIGNRGPTTETASYEVTFTR